jgi:DNA-binding CsgD family transcriptional regulator/tetratricopeptide (TPR) repeat protein
MHLLGNRVPARPLLEESKEICRRLNSNWELCYLLGKLAQLATQDGELKEAEEYAREELMLAQKLGDKSLIAGILCTLADLSARRNDLAQAVVNTTESLALARELGDKFLVALSLRNRGYFTALQGDLSLATDAQEGLALMRELGNKTFITNALYALGYIRSLQKNFAQAKMLYRDGLFLAQEIGGIINAGWHLFGLATVAIAEGQLLQAARLLGAAEARFDINLNMNATERSEYERIMDHVRSVLGRKAFAVAQDEGRTMTIEQALGVSEQIPVPQTPARPSSVPIYPDGLTAREVEILRLLAERKTTAQIAEQLLISPRTISRHITSIYQKIQVSSHSAAVRYAEEKELV